MTNQSIFTYVGDRSVRFPGAAVGPGRRVRRRQGRRQKHSGGLDEQEERHRRRGKSGKEEYITTRCSETGSFSLMTTSIYPSFLRSIPTIPATRLNAMNMLNLDAFPFKDPTTTPDANEVGKSP